MARVSRKPEIMGDAAIAILHRPSRECTGNFFIDEEVLVARASRISRAYAYDPNSPLMPDFFVPDAVARFEDQTASTPGLR